MKCPECRSDHIPDEPRFCPKCGTPLQAVPPSLGRKIIDYRDLIAKSTGGFVGRKWVRDEIDKFLKADGPRYFLLLGEPGSGKTAFMADLVKRRGYPHHFIGKGSLRGVAASPDWRDPLRFAESIGYQLLRDYGGWIIQWEDWGIHVSQKVKDLQGHLTGAEVGTFHALPRPVEQAVLTVEQEVEQYGPIAGVIGVYIEEFKVDVELVVRQLLTTPLTHVAERWPNDPLVIVLDGLDEAEGYSDPRGNILRMLPDGSLPPNVRFLLSSEPGDHLTSEFRSQCQEFWLSENGQQHPGVIHDAKAYLENLANEEPIQKLLRRHQVETETFRDKVAWASGGNFLYLRDYADGLRQGDETLLDVETLPQGLQGKYADFVRKIEERRGDVAWVSAYKPVLGALAVAEEPLSSPQISAFSTVERETVGTIVTRLLQYLDTYGEGRDARYAIHAPPFRKYLISEDNRDYIDGSRAHARIANLYLSQFGSKWSACDRYGLDHIVQHVLAAEMYDALPTVFTVQFMEARAASTGWHMPFVRDLQKVKAKRPEHVVVPALQILRGSHRNSLVSQEVVHMLKDVQPDLKAQGIQLMRPGVAGDEMINDAIAAVLSPADGGVKTLAGLLANATDVQIKGAIALALGEVKSREAVRILRTALIEVKPREDHASWCAADGLLSLSSPKMVEPNLIPTLLDDLANDKIKPSVKGRILYILGRLRVKLPFEEACALVAQGLELPGYSKVRAVDLTYLLLPKDEEQQRKWVQVHEPVLWQALGFRGTDVTQDRKPRWKDQWLRKRLVTALGRIGSAAAIPHLERLARDVERAGREQPEGSEEKRKCAALSYSIRRAIWEVQSRNL